MIWSPDLLREGMWRLIMLPQFQTYELVGGPFDGVKFVGSPGQTWCHIDGYVRAEDSCFHWRG
jgi:hypothetical protein